MTATPVAARLSRPAPPACRAGAHLRRHRAPGPVCHMPRSFSRIAGQSAYTLCLQQQARKRGPPPPMMIVTMSVSRKPGRSLLPGPAVRCSRKGTITSSGSAPYTRPGLARIAVRIAGRRLEPACHRDRQSAAEFSLRQSLHVQPDSGPRRHALGKTLSESELAAVASETSERSVAAGGYVCRRARPWTPGSASSTGWSR